MFEVEVTARFETREQAESARSDMNEVVGKHDGDLESDTITDLDDEDDMPECMRPGFSEHIRQAELDLARHRSY